MEIKRKTEIFVETNRRFVIHEPESAEQIFCLQCAEPTLTAEQTAELFKVSRRDIYRLIENGTVHFTETESGILLVCPSSLAGVLASRTKILRGNL
jgi:hypothetical protein